MLTGALLQAKSPLLNLIDELGIDSTQLEVPGRVGSPRMGDLYNGMEEKQLQDDTSTYLLSYGSAFHPDIITYRQRQLHLLRIRTLPAGLDFGVRCPVL